MPVAAKSAWVGCEYTYDHLGRSTDNRVLSYNATNTGSPMLGGRSALVGNTLESYGEGRFAVFASSIPGLAGSTGAQRQVFWRDRGTGETLMVSASASGVEGNGDSYKAAISADGLTVAFQSYASNLVASDTNGKADIFVWSARNPSAGVTRVSVGAGGLEANEVSDDPSLSGDGKVIAFSTYANNLSPGLSGNATSHVYRRDLSTGSNTLVSVDHKGVARSASLPVLSDDGNRLAFSTFWSLLASDPDGLWDIYVYTHSAGQLARVSLTSTGGERQQGNESTSRIVAPAISGNGRYVAYATTAGNVVPGDSNGLQDVFVVDITNGSVVRASVGAAGVQGIGDSPIGQGERVSLSTDGKWVAFTTDAGNLVDPASVNTRAASVVMRNWESGETRVVSGPARFGVSTAVSMSGNGAYVAFGSGTDLDGRFTSSGFFARFTGLAPAFSWVKD